MAPHTDLCKLTGSCYHDSMNSIVQICSPGFLGAASRHLDPSQMSKQHLKHVNPIKAVRSPLYV